MQWMCRLRNASGGLVNFLWENRNRFTLMAP